MHVGLALTVLAVLAVVIGSADLTRQLHDIEDAFVGAGKAGQSSSIVVTYLLVVCGLGIVSWLWIGWAVRKGKRWVRPVATVVFVVATGIALLNLVMEEYGRTLLPTLLGVAGVLPCVAGLAAVVLLWKRDAV
jgi:predicted permease